MATIHGQYGTSDELARTREQGYAIDDEENERGIICFGQAIYSADGRVEGAVSVSVPRYRLPAEGGPRSSNTYNACASKRA
ncbi:IclR family transcriptional regulator domain-containing protein [Aidingimonas lacisalsi]|uniref:IclR family transcriptional regulator domain-containing protein n=1 Tax=Aidingimonas lacisalsi TaxID=2604086 RepID=UPI0011D1C3DE